MAEPVTLTGEVVEVLYAQGSKSERLACILRTSDGGTWLLRRLGANPYDAGEWQTLAGSTIAVVGYLHRDTILVEDYAVITGSVPPRRDGPDEPPPSSPPPPQPRPRSGS